MNTESAIPSSPPSASGELFSRAYLRPERLDSDSKKFRVRLGAYVHAGMDGQRKALRDYLQIEAGISVPWTASGVDFGKFFAEAPIHDVLNAVTLIWRRLLSDEQFTRRLASHLVQSQSVRWLEFVARAMREEQVGYRLDERCGVHHFVDEEFERSRAAVLAGLGAPRYQAVRAAFEQAHGHLDAQPQDTKASVRSAFEAAEILAKLMVPEAQNLNKVMIEKRLKPLILESITIPTDRLMQDRLVDSFGLFVDSVHPYRHGQGVDDPIQPPLEIAIHVLSSVATALRWLVVVDSKRQKSFTT